MDLLMTADHRTGVLLVALSALTFSTAGIFTKGVSAPAWDVIFWRGVFSVAVLVAWIAARGRMHAEFARMGRSGWAAAVAGASGTAAFIPAFKLSTVANVALIYAAAPLLAAAFAWFWFRERMTLRVAAGCLGAAVGVAVIVGGSLESIALRGDLLALYMTCAIALVMVIYRRYPETPGAGPAVASSLLLVPIAFVFGDPLSNPPTEIAWMAGFGVVFAVASVTLAEGAKRLPSSETGLLSSLEAPFAPVLAWLILFETPPTQTVIGGLVVLIAVAATQITVQHVR